MVNVSTSQALAKLGNTFRVLCIYSSFDAGDGNNIDQTFADPLQARGQRGVSSRREASYLRNHSHERELHDTKIWHALCP